MAFAYFRNRARLRPEVLLCNVCPSLSLQLLSPPSLAMLIICRVVRLLLLCDDTTLCGAIDAIDGVAGRLHTEKAIAEFACSDMVVTNINPK